MRWGAAHPCAFAAVMRCWCHAVRANSISVQTGWSTWRLLCCVTKACSPRTHANARVAASQLTALSAVLQAVLSFDLGAPVGDVAWAPFSSTLFAAATEDGRVVAYDLAASTSEPVCEQAAVQQAQLTRLAFNPRLPLLLVGDDK